MATEIRTFGTQVDDSATGATPWSNPSNAASSNDSRATVSLTGSSNSHYHKNTNSSHASGTTLTSLDTPTQIKYRFEKRKAGNPSANIRDWKIYPVEGGSVVTTTNFADVGSDWGTSDSVVEYTQTTNLPSAATILASDWGVVIAVQNTNGVGSGQAELDFVDAEITFSAAAPFTATADCTTGNAEASATCRTISTGTASPSVGEATCAASMASTPPTFTGDAACTAGPATASALASTINEATAGPLVGPATCAAAATFTGPTVAFVGTVAKTLSAVVGAAVGQTWQRGDWKYQSITWHDTTEEPAA